MPIQTVFTRAMLGGALLSSMLLIAGCGEEKSPASHGPDAAGASWMLDTAPADVVPVARAKLSARQGETVAVIGRIGGRVTPIASDSSSFTIVDMSVKHCGQMEDDPCPTPWDYCCEPRGNLMANSATVQLVDADGAPLTTDPIAAGLGPLDQVVVVGTVGPRPSPDVLVINATAIHRPAVQDHEAAAE